jgi:PEP-CTERM motif
MKIVLWISAVAALLFFIIASAPNARADSYQPSFTHYSAAIQNRAFHTDNGKHKGWAQGNANSSVGNGSSASVAASVGENDNDADDSGDPDGPPVADPGPGMGSTGSTGVVTSPTAATPEPSSLVLLAVGVGLLVFFRKRFVIRLSDIA